MDIAAQLIPIDDINELNNDDSLYSVQSQSDPNTAYLVDFGDNYTCDCLSFPLISYCKHLAAIHFHFSEIVDIQPPETISTPPTHAHHSTVVSTGLLQLFPGPNNAGDTDKPEMASLNTIATKLEHLAARLHLLPHNHPPDEFQVLDSVLDNALFNTPRRHIVLPKLKRVTPNTRSKWKGPNGTQGHMGADVKGKKKRLHMDAYSGHQKPGIKVHTRETEPKKRKVEAATKTRYAIIDYRPIN
jgi:hypothetical protein